MPAPPPDRPPSGSFVPAFSPSPAVHQTEPAMPAHVLQQVYSSGIQPASLLGPQSVPQPAQPPVPGLPPPVSPASLPPPFRPSRNPIVRMLLWFTEPSMIKGMALGIILALVISVAFRLEAMWFIASSVLTLLITCLFGVLIGHYIFENRRKKVQQRGVEALRTAGGELPGLSNDLMTLLWNRDRAALTTMWERLRRMGPAASEVAGLSVAAIFRMMAMTTLFAVLGGAISFAVFLTSYMQVERMDAQNKLIERQIKDANDLAALAEQRQKIDVALSITERRQATARELLAVVNGDRSPEENGKRRLKTTTANLIAVGVAQLQPYRSVGVGPDGNSVLAAEVKSPEQEQLLRYLAAADVDFDGLDLTSAFLDHADLHATDLSGLHAAGVNIRRAKLYDAKISGAELREADLSFSILARSDLSGSNLSLAKLRKANLGDVVFADANLAGADLSGAIVKKAVFKQTQLGGAVLHGANLGQCDLNGADITGADLALADLSAAILPPVPRVREAGFWWLGIYSADYAAKLGVSPEALQRNQAALGRLQTAPDDAAMAAIVQELKNAAPTAPG